MADRNTVLDLIDSIACRESKTWEEAKEFLEQLSADINTRIESLTKRRRKRS
jgi:hypothetical protein